MRRRHNDAIVIEGVQIVDRAVIIALDMLFQCLFGIMTFLYTAFGVIVLWFGASGAVTFWGTVIAGWALFICWFLYSSKFRHDEARGYLLLLFWLAASAAGWWEVASLQ
jgi:hypothetical protein